jgi:hypothetical protein
LIFVDLFFHQHSLSRFTTGRQEVNINTHLLSLCEMNNRCAVTNLRHTPKELTQLPLIILYLWDEASHSGVHNLWIFLQVIYCGKEIWTIIEELEIFEVNHVYQLGFFRETRFPIGIASVITFTLVRHILQWSIDSNANLF